MSFTLFIDPGFADKTGKILTFIITTVSMALGLTLIPLLPPPLPLIVAFLVAYMVYREPPVGALAGSVVIGVGLLYHLSRIGFFVLFPSPLFRVFVMAMMILPFLIVPPMIADNLTVIAMDIGIVAVSLLFFRPTFYLAIPFILVFATIYKNKGVLVTFLYYAFISLPLQVMQYLKTYQVGVPPSLYTPLDIIYKDIQRSMSKVSLSEIIDVLRVVGGQIVMDTGKGGALGPALASYVDSLPGMFLFLIIISALVSAAALLTLKLPDSFRRTRLPGRYADVVAYVLPAIMASVTNVIFFILLDNLQRPLAFRAMVNPPILIMSTSFTLAYSAPVSLSKYLLDLKMVLAKRTEDLERRAKALLADVQYYLSLIDRTVGPMPKSLSSLRMRMLIVADELKEMAAKASEGGLSLKEADAMMRKVYTEHDVEINNFLGLLGVALGECYIRIKFRYLEAVREIRELGLDLDTPEIPDLQADSDLESKIEHIEEAVEAGRALVKGLIATSDEIYEIICSLFEPSLPRDSPIIQISREKSEEDEPWVIIDAILASMRNWERHYAADILKSTRPIRYSVDKIIELSEREDPLLPILGDRFRMIKALSQEVARRDFGMEEGGDLKVLKVIFIRDTILATVEVVGRVIGILCDHLRDLEKTIDSLQPVGEYEWNRNLTLVERMDSSLDVIRNYERYEINDIVSHLYRALSYMDEAVDTIEYYNERREMLLNYRVIEKKIDRILRERDEVSLEDLGVSEKYGREYIKLYHRSHYPEFPLEETGRSLRRTR